MQSTFDSLVAVFEQLDLVALAVFFLVSFGISRLVEHSSEARPSTALLMARFRREWMHESPNRSNRMVDSSLLISQRGGAAFFASGSMIAIGGLAALLGQTDRLLGVAQDIVADIEASRLLWELKLMFILILLVDAFLKFVWSHRVFGYCAVLLGAMPEDRAAAGAEKACERASVLNITAGRSFNRGLRAIYFALAALAWFLGPEAFIAAVLFTAGVIYRREFLSETRRALL